MWITSIRKIVRFFFKNHSARTRLKIKHTHVFESRRASFQSDPKNGRCVQSGSFRSTIHAYRKSEINTLLLTKFRRLAVSCALKITKACGFYSAINPCHTVSPPSRFEFPLPSQADCSRIFYFIYNIICQSMRTLMFTLLQTSYNDIYLLTLTIFL